MDDDGMIDPVAVSSCIFMEDETSETEARFVINKVCDTLCDSVFIFLHSYCTNNNHTRIAYRIIH